MTDKEKKKLLKNLQTNNIYSLHTVYHAMEDMGDMKFNYTDYMETAPVNANEELKRLPNADYELCTALLTMLLREDYFCNGSFERRCDNGQVKDIIDRMIELL